MKHLVVLFSFSILSVAALGEDPSVLMPKPMVRLVRNFQLPQACGTSKKIYACTAFVGQVLTCQCQQASPGGSGWRIAARAQFIPVMYVTGPDYVAHENKHIRDIEKAVGDYIAGLSALQFDSAEACQQTATQEARRFPGTMDRFKDGSNARHHPGYQRKF